MHNRSDKGLEFRSIAFRKWCGEINVNIDTVAPKHQERNGQVERHEGAIIKVAKTLLLNARLDRKFFYYVVYYEQHMHA